MIKGARFGFFNDKKLLFTHYNPDRHEVWCDDLAWGWVNYDRVKWNLPKITFKGGKARVKH